MNKVNEILTEWTYQLESGYPKKDEDYIVLQNILQESTDFDQSKIHRIVDRARGLQEDEALNKATNNDTPDIIPDSEVETVTNKLIDAFSIVMGKYSKYIRVINDFAPGAVGSMSESLLATLINKYVPESTAEAVGTRNELTDIIVDGHEISLKASLGSKVIPLSVDTELWPAGSSAESKTQLYTKYAAGSEGNKTKQFGDKSIRFIQTLNQMNLSEEPDDKEIFEMIENRLIAIAKKLSDINFVWIEKRVNTKKILTGLIIHIRTYEYQTIMNEFLNSYLYFSPVSWGILGQDGQIIIGAETGKELNIHPRFIRKTSTGENTIPIDFKIPDSTQVDIKSQISSQMLDALEQMSTIYDNKEI